MLSQSTNPNITFVKGKRTSSDLGEALIQGVLAILASIPILITLILVGVFIYEAFFFFVNVTNQFVETPEGGDFQSQGLWAGVVKFFSETEWTVEQFEPGDEVFRAGIVVLVVSTLMVSGIAMLVAIPLGILAAVYLSEYAPGWLRLALKPVLESISGVPTVVLGYFGFLTITPLLKQVFPELAAQNGLTAGIVIGVFLIPIISSLSEEALRSVPNELRESGYAVGMTKLEIVWRIVVPSAFPGIVAAISLAASRAFGETMIALLAGGRGGTQLSFNPLEVSTTLTAFIVGTTDRDLNPGSFPRSASFTVGLILFLITLIFNTFGNWLVRKNQAWLSSALVAKADVVASTALLSSNRIDQTIEAVSHSPHHTEKSVVFAPAFGTREAIGRLFHGFALVCTLAGIGFLGVIIYQNVVSGLPKLDWQFLTSFQSIDPEKAGILVPLAGTFVITILTALFVIPIGVGGAIFLEEYLQDSWWKRVIDVQIANLSAVPSIIYGLLGLGLFVRLQQIIANDNQVGRNVLSAALTLTLIVLPVQIISTRTALQNIPDSLRYAAYALGMSKWQMIWRVVLPTATPAITTGALLALTVAIGETAALIAVGSVKTITILPTSLDSQFLTLPVQIYYWNTEGEKFEAINSAAIITLIAILLVISFSTVLIRNLFMRKIR